MSAVHPMSSRVVNPIRVLLCVAMLPLLGGCFGGGAGRQRSLTGEPVLYGVDPISGALLHRDVVPRPDDAALGAVPHEGEMIAVVLNSVFIRHLEPLLRSRVLVYAEVYDDASDDPSTAVTRVLFDQEGQPAGVHASVFDKLLYGPTPYKGYPLRIRLYVVELAKDQKQTAGRIIDAVGTIASTAQPQAAPAVGLVIQAARLVNELTEDAFELRCDMTLYPVSGVGTADLADPTLSQFNEKQGVAEPVQRQGRQVSLVTPLRIGQYAVIKRELTSRFGASRVAQRADLLPGVTAFDWTQEGFTIPYRTTDGRDVQAQEFVRVAGGTLNWFVAAVPESPLMVVPGYGPNKGVPTSLSPGISSKAFDEQTYAVLSVLNNLPKGLDAAGLAAQSQRDRERIGRLLDNPDQRMFSERIGEQIDALSASVKTVIEQRQMAQEASEQVAQNPEFRTSTAYPAFWSSRVRLLSGDDGNPLPANDTRRVNAVAHNRAILPILRRIVVDLPPLEPDDHAQMAALRALTKDDYAVIEGRKGVFNLAETDNAKALRGAANGGAGEGAGAPVAGARPATQPMP